MVFSYLPVSGPTGAAAIALVSLLVFVRLYAGSRLLDPKHMTLWGVVRRIGMPLVDQVAKRSVGISAENAAHRDEFVHDVDATPVEVRDALIAQSDERWEVSVLSGLKTDWAENHEQASLVCYFGDKPTPGAPDWLRDKQTHVFLFSAGIGTRICCHNEANSWRPDQWQDHLFKGPSFDAQAGVERVDGWLEESSLSIPADYTSQ
jgi:hypothetical protein